MGVPSNKKKWVPEKRRQPHLLEHRKGVSLVPGTNVFLLASLKQPKRAVLLFIKVPLLRGAKRETKRKTTISGIPPRKTRPFCPKGPCAKASCTLDSLNEYH